MLGRPTLTFRSLLHYGLIVLGVGLLLLYASWQARLLIVGPVITLTEEPSVTQTTRTVTLSGNTANITGITLNDRVIYTDKNGYFKETVVLENGYTIITFKGTDRYGRTITLERNFIYTP